MTPWGGRQASRQVVSGGWVGPVDRPRLSEKDSGSPLLPTRARVHTHTQARTTAHPGPVSSGPPTCGPVRAPGRAQRPRARDGTPNISCG